MPDRPLRPAQRDPRANAPALLAASQARRARAARAARRERIAIYTDRAGAARELIVRPGAGGSTLVVDRDRRTRRDQRLVAHLASDEPPVNADLVCRSYIGDGAARCRALTAADLVVEPFPTPSGGPLVAVAIEHPVGGRFRLATTRGEGAGAPRLRWRRRAPLDAPEDVVSLRETIGWTESYEPACALTAAALARHAGRDGVTTTVLRLELQRVQRSPIVLNRGLREAVRAAVGSGRLSMSEIAMRCGRVKRDGRGNRSGETSWLARRLGLLAEGGQSHPTPWIHSDVLALIARCGLGVSPREVEL
jgi:hypothetical protein